MAKVNNVTKISNSLDAGISNMKELRELMLAKLAEIDSGTANILEADQFTKLSGKIISSVMVEVRAAEVTHDIAFLK